MKRTASRPIAPSRGRPDEGRAPAARPTAERRAVVAAVIVVVIAVALMALGAWRLWTLLTETRQPTVDRTQLEQLRLRLDAVHRAITPIARSFTSEESSAPIDVAAYRRRIEAARTVVSDVNEVRVTSPDAIEIRDAIITGGTEVLDGMDAALTALESDEASAADEASGSVEEGLGLLEDAGTRLEQLLGTRSRT